MATAKQIAARKLFAERARSGAFKKRKARKANPARTAGEVLSYVRKLQSNNDALRAAAKPRKVNAIDPDTARQIREVQQSIKLLNDQVLNAIDARNWVTADKLDRQRDKLLKLLSQLRGEKPSKPIRQYADLAKRQANPAVTVKSNRKSFYDLKSRDRLNREDKAASLRLRKKAAARRSGLKLPYSVQWSNHGSEWKTLGSFATEKDALQYAKSYANAYPRFTLRVID